MVVADEEVEGGRRAVVFDFGIAKLAAEQKHPTTQADQTDLRIAIGTATYIAPEQAVGGEPLTSAVDVYSLGVMLYELLCGAPPFSARSYALLLDMHRYSAALAIDKVVPGLPTALSLLVTRMLAKAAAERPSMAEVTAGLDHVLQELTTEEPAPGKPEPTPTVAALPIPGGEASPGQAATDLEVASARVGAPTSHAALPTRSAEPVTPPLRRRRNTEPLPQQRDSTTLPLARLLAAEETLPPTRLREGGPTAARLAPPSPDSPTESETIPIPRTDADATANATADRTVDTAPDRESETRPPLRPQPRQPPWGELPPWALFALALWLFLAGFLLRAYIGMR